MAAFLEGLGQGGRTVNIMFASDAEMRALNRIHRGKDRATDVLSWSYLDTPGNGPDTPLGELAISLERARAQALENGWSLRTELLRLLAHGCAHLAGHDHETPAQERAMRTLEEALLQSAGLSGLYPPADTIVKAGKGTGPVKPARRAQSGRAETRARKRRPSR